MGAMSDTPGYQRLFAELKRRKVFKVAAVYGAVCFGVLQVADILVPAMDLPDAVVRGIALVCMLGFPIALVLAWAFETTPEGVRRTLDAELARSRRSCPLRGPGDGHPASWPWSVRSP